MFLKRDIQEKILKLYKQYPVIIITGPRQSGKTTLCKKIFVDKPYVSMENLEIRKFAQSDPIRFLSQFPKGAVLDEVQRVPELFSYIQTVVDQKNKAGMFILTGSSQFELVDSKHLYNHPLRGSLFETFIIMEVLKERFNKVQMDNLYYFRDNVGNEVDLLIEEGKDLVPIEIKSSQSVPNTSSYKPSFLYFQKLVASIKEQQLVYAGENSYTQEEISISSYRDFLLA